MNYTLSEAVITALADWDILHIGANAEISDSDITASLDLLLESMTEKIAELKSDLVAVSEQNKELSASIDKIHYEYQNPVDIITDSDEMLADLSELIREQAKKCNVAWIGTEGTLKSLFGIDAEPDVNLEVLGDLEICVKQCAQGMGIEYDIEKPVNTLKSVLDAMNNREWRLMEKVAQKDGLVLAANRKIRELEKTIYVVKERDEKDTKRIFSLLDFIKRLLSKGEGYTHFQRQTLNDVITREIDGFYLSSSDF